MTFERKVSKGKVRKGGSRAKQTIRVLCDPGHLRERGGHPLAAFLVKTQPSKPLTHAQQFVGCAAFPGKEPHVLPSKRLAPQDGHGDAVYATAEVCDHQCLTGDAWALPSFSYLQGDLREYPSVLASQELSCRRTSPTTMCAASSTSCSSSKARTKDADAGRPMSLAGD